MMRATAMLIKHIGFVDKGLRLEAALDICGQYEKKLVVTGRPTGATGEAFTNYLMETIQDANLKSRWEGYVKG